MRSDWTGQATGLRVWHAPWNVQVAACNGDGWFWMSRELMRDLSLAKYDGNGKIRPFGGLNVILAGDVYQLPPPKGTFLGDIPWDLLAGRKSTRQAPGHQGQTLLWGEAAAGMQGMTELVRCERTQDAWLAELQGELRHGQLSDDNHKFLHGKPTTVPGSWIAGHATCEQPGCAALPTLGLRPEAIQEAECSHCAADRRSRILVAQGGCGHPVSERICWCSCNFRHQRHQISCQQASRHTVGKCQTKASIFVCCARCCIVRGRAGEAEFDSGEIAMVAATRQRVRWAIRRVAVVRRHACPCNRPLGPEARHSQGHQRPRRGLVRDCQWDACTWRSCVQRIAGGGVCEVWNRDIVADTRYAR